MREERPEVIPGTGGQGCKKSAGVPSYHGDVVLFEQSFSDRKGISNYARRTEIMNVNCDVSHIRS